jgi:hypothetical protein
MEDPFSTDHVIKAQGDGGSGFSARLLRIETGQQGILEAKKATGATPVAF